MLWGPDGQAAGVLYARVSGRCYWCEKQRALSDGGLPKAQLQDLPLDQLLQHRYDEAGVESEWLRWRHVAGLAEGDLWALESRRYEGGRDE